MEAAERIRNAIACCLNANPDEGCKECPYTDMDACIVALVRDAREIMKERDAILSDYQELARDYVRIKRRVRKLKRRITKTNWHKIDEKEPPLHTELKVWTKEGREFIATFTLNDEWITDGFLQVRGVTHWAYLDEAPKEAE